MDGRITHWFTRADKASRAPVGEIRTSVTVAGDVSGQLAVGSHIVQMRVDTVLGNLVTVLPPDTKANVTPRPVPISLVPRRPTLIVGREHETSLAVEALSNRRVVELYAPAGMGKSTLLRSLAHQLPISEACGGMAHLSARGLSHDDLLQVLFDVFYSSDIPVKPPPGELRHRLQNVRAALLLDDVDLPGNDIEDVEDYAPECGFILTAASDPGVSEALTIELTGLRGADARELIAHALGRPVGPEEQPAVDALCDLVHGSPAGLLRLASSARDHDGSLADFAASVVASGVPPLPVESEEDVRVLGLLAAIPGVHLDIGQLSEITGMADVQERIDALVTRGLVLASAPPVSSGARVDYSLAQGVDLGPAGVWQMSRRRDELRTYFLRLAEQRSETLLAPGAPPETLRALHSDAVRRRDWRYVLGLGVLLDAAYALSGRWDAWREVSQGNLLAARSLGDSEAEAHALHQLGTRALCDGQTSTATELLRSALTLRTALGAVAAAKVTAHNLSLIAVPPILTPEQPDHSVHHDQGSSAYGDDGGATAVHSSGAHGGSTGGATSGAHASGAGAHATAGHGAFSVTGVTTAAGVAVAGAVVAGMFLVRSHEPAVATVALDQTALSFPPVALNQPSEAQTFAARNVGKEPVRVSGFETSGVNSSDFVVTSSTCRAEDIPAGKACTATVVFTPTGSGPRQASVTVRVSGAGEDPMVSLSGSSSGPDAASPKAMPTELSFGEQPLNTSGQRRQVTITGPAATPVVLGTASVSGLAAADFLVEDDTCSGTQLVDNATCTVGVRFTASAQGPRQGLLALPGPDGVHGVAVPLSGSGAAPEQTATFEVQPRAVSFGEQPLGSPSPPRQVLLRNTGDQPLDVAPLAVQGNPDFTLAEAACPATLGPGEDCAATVVFTPVSTGPRTAQLFFGGRGPTVPLSGAGAKPPSAGPDIAPRVLDFGNQLIGGVSAPQRVTVTNRADKPLRLGPAADPTTGAFRSDDAACTGRDVRPGARCDVAVTFAPTVAGQYSGVLLLAADGFPDVAVVLRGAGIDMRAPPVPDVTGMTLAQARSELSSKGFVTGHIQQVAHPDVPKGSVADQLPRGGFSLDQGGSVDLFVSTGPEPVTVPDVAGLRESEAAGRLVGAGLQVGAIRLETDPSVPQGQVLSSTPPGGTRVAAGTPVGLTVSAGDERPSVPDVRGLTESQATTRIIGVGLVVGTISRPYDESVPQGVVISSDPVADTRLDPGKAVALAVSAGPAPVTVPEVVGRTESDATAEIKHVGLQVGAVTREADCSIPENEVLSSTPSAGTEVEPGTPVGLTVSSGEPLAIVPEVVGRSEADATSALRAAGFQADVTTRSDESVPTGVVITSEPSAGSSASTCRPVGLTVSSGPAPVPVPPVVGRVQDDAETLLVKGGLQVGVVTPQTSCEIGADVVISSNPEPGATVSRGTRVALVVSSGEPQATVPDVVNHPEAEARTLLEQAGFQVGDVTKQVDQSVPNGAVISSSPGGHTSASTCHPVDLVVSQYVEVPNVVGKTEADATDALTKAGLKVTVSNEDACEGVDATDPAAGTRVAPDSPVTIYVCGIPSNVNTADHQKRPILKGSDHER